MVPKTQQGYSLVQNPAPQGEKVARRSERSLAWGVWKDAHHRARAVTDACIMRASYRSSRTNCQNPNRFLNPYNTKNTVRQLRNRSRRSLTFVGRKNDLVGISQIVVPVPGMMSRLVGGVVNRHVIQLVGVLCLSCRTSRGVDRVVRVDRVICDIIHGISCHIDEVEFLFHFC